MFSLVFGSFALVCLTAHSTTPEEQTAIASIAGVYEAAVGGETYATSGGMRVVINRLGRGTVSIRLGGEKACVVFYGLPDFLWDGSPIPIIFIPTPGADMSGDLKIIPGGDSTKIEGTVTDDGHTLPVLLTKTATTATAGQWTFIAKDATNLAPVGSGAARINARGHAAGLFQLAGHKRVAFRGQMNESGTVPVSIAFGKDRGSLVGDVKFPSGSVTLYDLTGNHTLALTGTAYDAKSAALGPVPGTLNLFPDINSFSVGSIHYAPPGTFFGGLLGADKLKLTLNRPWGTVSGSSLAARFSGVVNQADRELTALDEGRRVITGSLPK